MGAEGACGFAAFGSVLLDAELEALPAAAPLSPAGCALEGCALEPLGELLEGWLPLGLDGCDAWLPLGLDGCDAGALACAHTMAALSSSNTNSAETFFMT